jgi:hypothetical protein
LIGLQHHIDSVLTTLPNIAVRVLDCKLIH